MCIWSTVKYLVVIILPEVNMNKRGIKVKKDDLAESSVLHYFSLYCRLLVVKTVW